MKRHDFVLGTIVISIGVVVAYTASSRHVKVARGKTYVARQEQLAQAQSRPEPEAHKTAAPPVEKQAPAKGEMPPKPKVVTSPRSAPAEQASSQSKGTDAVAGKAYFACLVLHRRLAGKGMRFLPIRHSPAYYKAVSVAELPDDCAIVKPFESKRPIGAKRRKTAMDVASEAGPADGGCEESFADTKAVWE